MAEGFGLWYRHQDRTPEKLIFSSVTCMFKAALHQAESVCAIQQQLTIQHIQYNIQVQI